MAQRIGELLVKNHLITEAQLEQALQEQTQNGDFLGEILIRLGFVTEADLLKSLAEQFNTRYVSLEQVRINPIVLKMVPKDLVWEYKFMPIETRSSILLIAVSNPLDMWPMSVLKERLDLSEVQIVLAQKDDILKAIFKYYGLDLGGGSDGGKN